MQLQREAHFEDAVMFVILVALRQVSGVSVIGQRGKKKLSGVWHQTHTLSAGCSGGYGAVGQGL